MQVDGLCEILETLTKALAGMFLHHLACDILLAPLGEGAMETEEDKDGVERHDPLAGRTGW